MSDIVSAEAAAQEGEALLPSAELAKNLGLTLAASVVLAAESGHRSVAGGEAPAARSRSSTSTADESFSIFAAWARTISSSEGSAARRLNNAAINIETCAADTAREHHGAGDVVGGRAHRHKAVLQVLECSGVL